jgi:hypothetical protein
MSGLGGKDDMNIISALREPQEGGPSKEDVFNTVPIRFQGTRADQADMIVLGKKQVLRVSVTLSLLASTRLTSLVAELQVHHDAWIWVKKTQYDCLRHDADLNSSLYRSTVICSWEVILP